MSPTDPKSSRRTPETLRIRSVAPALTVNNLQASLAWYRDIIGFVVGEEWKHDGELRGVSLKAGSAELYLAQDDWAMGRDRKKGEGFRLHLGTAQDVDQLAAEIKKRGGALASEPADMPWGVRAFTLVDPDGFKLSIEFEG
jgi:uncharacterized glyoxalase superfamily protein PhnB